MPLSEPTTAQRFEQITAPHLSAAYNLARWLTRDPHDAEDVVQEAYLRALRYFDSFRGDDGKAWLLTIVRNTFYSWHRQKRGGISLEPDGADEIANTADDATQRPDAWLARLDDQRAIEAAIGSLPLEFREVIILRELEELSYKEIADVAGLPVGTVMSRLSRARTLLRAALSQGDLR
jgi:RNA polymerase sigma-70 factor (ECF subfamily)